MRELHQLNDIVVKHYSPEYDIYFMQGACVSLYSSALTLPPYYLYFGEKPLVRTQHSFKTVEENERFLALFELMNKNSVIRLKTLHTFSPLINLNCMHTEYPSLDKLSATEKRNLLFWYLGYFFIFNLLRDTKKLFDYIHYNEFNGVPDLGPFYNNCLSKHIALTKYLAKVVNPQVIDQDINVTLDFIHRLNSAVGEDYDFAGQLPQMFFDALVPIASTANHAILHAQSKPQPFLDMREDTTLH